jgi:hypothetical protein
MVWPFSRGMVLLGPLQLGTSGGKEREGGGCVRRKIWLMSFDAFLAFLPPSFRYHPPPTPHNKLLLVVGGVKEKRRTEESKKARKQSKHTFPRQRLQPKVSEK